MKEETCYTEEFKRDAVFHVTDRGYFVKEVFIRLDVSTKSLCDWIKRFKNPEMEHDFK